MKTLTINGLVFTNQPPTKEGWWLWTETESVGIIAGTVCKGFENKEWLYFCGEGSFKPVNIRGGFWHELIPRGVFAEEVEKAWEEGYLDGAVRKDNAWPKSRAKLVSEGKEPKV